MTELERLKKEILQLREENARLRGIEERGSDYLSIDSHLFSVSSLAFAKLFLMFARKRKFRAVLEYNPKFDKIVVNAKYDDYPDEED